MPIHRKHSGAVLANVLGNPPVSFLFVETNRNKFSTRSHCKLFLIGTPFDCCGSTVDAQNNQRWFPFALYKVPHISVAIM